MILRGFAREFFGIPKLSPILPVSDSPILVQHRSALTDLATYIFSRLHGINATHRQHKQRTYPSYSGDSWQSCFSLSQPVSMLPFCLVPNTQAFTRGQWSLNFSTPQTCYAFHEEQCLLDVHTSVRWRLVCACSAFVILPLHVIHWFYLLLP